MTFFIVGLIVGALAILGLIWIAMQNFNPFG
jgi:hypothetical protein